MSISKMTFSRDLSSISARILAMLTMALPLKVLSEALEYKVLLEKKILRVKSGVRADQFKLPLEKIRCSESLYVKKY